MNMNMEAGCPAIRALQSIMKILMRLPLNSIVQQTPNCITGIYLKLLIAGL